MSGTVVPPGWRLPSGRAPPELGGGDLETWKSRGEGTGTRKKSAVAVHDAFTTVSTCDGDDKKNPVTVVRFFARGRRFQKPVRQQVKKPKRYLRWSVQGFSNTQTQKLPKHPFNIHFYNPLPLRRRGDRGFTHGSRGTTHGLRPAKIRFVTPLCIFAQAFLL